MFEIGQKITKANYTAAAVWCNQHGAHIAAENGEYQIVANEPFIPDVRLELADMEKSTGLTRAVREVVLAENSGASAYVRQKAQDLETLARELRHECGNI